MDSQEPVIETIVATVAEIDPNDLIVGYSPDNGEDSGKNTFEKVISAGAVASHVVALGATKVADVAAPAIAKGVEKATPVIERGAKKTAKGAVKLTTIGLQSLGKGLSALGSKLKGSEQETEEIQYVTVSQSDALEEADAPLLEAGEPLLEAGEPLLTEGELLLEETPDDAEVAETDVPIETPSQE